MLKKAVVLLAVSLLAANLSAAPTLKALWLTNAQNTNSVKPAIDMLAKRIGIPVALERREIAPFEKAKAISDEELKPLHAINPDFVVMTFGENVKSKSAYGDEMTKWIKFFRSFRKLPKRPEMVMCANADERNPTDKGSPVWRTLVAATARAETDFLMTGDLDAEGVNSRVAEILHARTFPRIVPLAPKLSEIDPATGEIEFYYPGRFPRGRANYVLRAGIDNVWRTSAPVGEDGHVKMRLGAMSEGEHSLKVQLADLTIGHHPAVSQAVYQMRAKRVVRFDAGRRLNNLVTELYSGRVGGQGAARPTGVDEIAFVNPRDGWVAFVVGSGQGATRPTICLDGTKENIMPKARDELSIAMRWLTAGRHSVSIGRAVAPRPPLNGQDARSTGIGPRAAADGWRISIRAVKAIRIRDANGNWSEMHRRFINPYVNIGTPYNDSGLYRAFGAGASPSNGLIRLAERGCRLIPSVNMDPHGLALRRDVKTVEDKIRTSVAWRLGMEVAIDENRVGMETEYLHHYTMAEAIWRLATPSQAISMFWAGCTDGNKFRDPERLSSELSAISNSGDGRGLHIFETYQYSMRNFADVEKQFDNTIACIKSMTDMAPATKGSAICYFGTYFFPGSYTPLVSPYADHRVLLDAWVRRLATDSEVEELIAGIGSGSYHHTDEEMVRWIAALIRHYAIKGRTDSLAEKLGYGYNPGFVANPDFYDGLNGWTADAANDGSITPLRIPGYGGGVQARKGAKGEGDHMALFVRDAKCANRLSQTVKGLVPGRHYALVFYSSDYDEHLARKAGNKYVPQGRRRLRVDFRGGTNVPALELHHFGASGIKPGKFSICRNRYVFRADAPEVTLTFVDRNADEGEAVQEDVGLRQIVNFVEMHEYFTGGMSVEEIAEVTGGKR